MQVTLARIGDDLHDCTSTIMFMCAHNLLYLLVIDTEQNLVFLFGGHCVNFQVSNANVRPSGSCAKGTAANFAESKKCESATYRYRTVHWHPKICLVLLHVGNSYSCGAKR